MKIISTNIGNPKTIYYNNQLVSTGIFKNAVKNPLFLGKEDVEKDHVIDRRYHGGPDKACYLYSASHYKYWKNKYPELEMPWGMFGENLTVEGLHEASVNIGDIFKAGNAVFQATQPRQPCFKLEFRFADKKIVKNFIDSGFSGVYVRVLKEGFVKTGDMLELLERKESLSIQKIFYLLYAEDFEEDVNVALSDPFLAASCKKDLLKRWGRFLS